MNKLGTMKAVQLAAPGPPQALHLRDLPMPQPSAGWVRIRVEAFGLNRSELHLRLGLAEGVTFPRVPGIECAGVVDAAPGISFRPGQQVVAMMGGMGRVFDGGYAQYAVAPASQVIPIRTDLPLEVIGALPEMLQTAYGSLTVGLDLQRGQSLLIRGGASSVGLAPSGSSPSARRLTGEGGIGAHLRQAVLQRYLAAIAAGRFSVPIHQIYELEQIQEAHATMEKNEAVGKLVVRVRPP